MAPQDCGDDEGGDNQRRRVRPRLELDVDYNPFAPPAAEYDEALVAGLWRRQRQGPERAGPGRQGSPSAGPAPAWLLQSRSVLLDARPFGSPGIASSPAHTLHSRSPPSTTPATSSMSSSPPPDRISGQKRTRVPADDDAGEDDIAQVSGASALELGVPVHQRACVRCKNLKVKCEVKSINEVVSEPCRRCKNAGYECVLPGTKKRKAPPKRGDLMQTIQDQAAQIRHLQEQLYAIRNGHLVHPSASFGNASAPRGSAFGSPLETGPQDAPEPEVRNWIIAAVSEQSEDEDDAEETEDEEHGSSSLGNGYSQTSSGDSQRSPAGRSTLRGVTSTIPSEASPLGMMASLSIQASGPSQKRGGRGSDHIEEEGVGLPEPSYFEKGPAPDSLRGTLSSVNQKLSPSIFTKKIITTQEAEQLFRIYYERINASTFLLDPTLYSAQQTCLRNTFLFTVVCAIASRFMTSRPELYDQLMEHALIAAGVTLNGGAKSVEIVYAYILLALYPRPQRRWEDDRSWWYLGIAYRVSMDLNIHHPPQVVPTEEKKAREALNRTRAWTTCWIWDRLFGSFAGRDPLEFGHDWIKAKGEEWYRLSEWNIPGNDPMISAMVVSLKCLYKHRSKIYTDPSAHMGLNLKHDFRVLGNEADTELSELQTIWIRHLRQLMPDNAISRHQISLLNFYYTYFRLRYLNFCTLHTSEAQHQEDPTMLRRLYTATLALIRWFQQDLAGPNLATFFKHGPECNSLVVTIAGTVLVRLLRAPLVSFFGPDEQQQMREEIQCVINILASSDIAVDERHGPHHHARFLALVSQRPAPGSSPNSEQQMLTPGPGNPTGGYAPGPYGAKAMSPSAPMPLSSAFEPALMDLYNTSGGASVSGWSYAPGATTGVYGGQALGAHTSGVPASDTREWYAPQQDFFPSAYALQDAMRYPPATAPAPPDMGATGMHSQWATSAGQWMSTGYAGVPVQGQMYGYPAHQ